MEMVQIKCPNCGGRVDVSKNLKTATCKYCQTLVALEWKNNEKYPHVDNLCPFCEEPVKSDFLVCPHCGETVTFECPVCRKRVKTTWTVCPYCKEKLPDEAERRMLENRPKGYCLVCKKRVTVMTDGKGVCGHSGGSIARIAGGPMLDGEPEKKQDNTLAILFIVGFIIFIVIIAVVSATNP